MTGIFSASPALGENPEQIGGKDSFNIIVFTGEFF